MSLLSTLPVLAFLLVNAGAVSARAQASEASALSAVPIGVLSAAPVAVLLSGAHLTVLAVEASADGTTWVLQRASDGARASVKLAGTASVAAGTRVAVTVVSAGCVLSVAGRAIAFIPNAVGAALLQNERVTR